MSNNAYDKPFKTYDEMIELLKSRNIIIEDKEFAKKALSDFSYYSLINGYKDTFLTLPSSNSFIPGTKFESLYFMNQVDSNINTILFKYILHIEKSLKSKLSYRVAEKHGVFTDTTTNSIYTPNDYLYKNYYSNSNGRRENTLNKLKSEINKNSDKKVVKHYTCNKNHLPPWILTLIISFGETINWYLILKDTDKTYVCEQFLPDQNIPIIQRKEFLTKAFNLTREYRNIIAHGSKAISLHNLPVLPKQPTLVLADNLLSSNEYDNKLGQNDIYSILIILLILIDDKLLLRNLYYEIYVYFRDYEKLHFNNKTIYEVLGVPKDILERIDSYLSTVRKIT